MDKAAPPTKLCIRFQREGEAQDIVAEGDAGEKLTQVAYRAGVVIQQTCGGSPSCTDCRVVVKEGGNDAFEPMEHAELTLMGNVFHITKERLACQAVIRKDSTVFVPKPKIPRKKEFKRR